jgi:hypothetical protein
MPYVSGNVKALITSYIPQWNHIVKIWMLFQKYIGPKVMNISIICPIRHCKLNCPIRHCKLNIWSAVWFHL